METINIKLFSGDYATIGTEITDDKPAAWAGVIAGSDLMVLRDASIASVRKVCNMLTHIANGDFKTWTADRHYPRRPLEIAIPGMKPVEGFDLPESSVVKGMKYDELRFGPTGWVEISNGKVLGKVTEEAISLYHTRVRHLQNGGSLIFPLPAFRSEVGRQNWIREFAATIALGEGKAWEHRQELREDAIEASEVYKSTKNMRLNGRTEELDLPSTNSAEPNKIVVKTIKDTFLNMYTVPIGTVAHIYGESGARLYNLEWDPTDDALLGDWKNLSNMKRLRVSIPA